MTTLYKYCDQNGLNILNTGKLKFTPPDRFNDPFDINPQVIAFTEEEQKEISLMAARKTYYSRTYEGHELRRLFQSHLHLLHAVETKKTTPENIALLKKTMHDSARDRMATIRAEIGILCLSEAHENHAMWAYYADNHRGMLIGFNADHSWFDQRKSKLENFNSLRKIKYTDERQRFNIVPKADYGFFYTKSPHWKHEEEWRMIMPLESLELNAQSGEHYRTIDYGIISEIVLGCRMQRDLRKNVIRAIEGNKKMAHVKIKSADIKPKNFAFDYKTIGKHRPSEH